MAFPSDARNHYNAINSELNLIRYNSQIEDIFGKKIKDYAHLGGTKNKTDVKIIFVDGTFEDVSLKTKKDIKKGSFDWINTSSLPKHVFSSSYDIFNRYRGLNDKSYKVLLENTINLELNGMDEDIITNFFINEVYKKYSNNKLVILVIDEKHNKVYKVSPKIFDLVNNGFKLTFKRGKGKTSTKVLCENKEGVQIDLGLRIRIHLNNGWSKWFRGESSVLCLKFQQDSVYKMINK
jgi:hypothetical protein